MTRLKQIPSSQSLEGDLALVKLFQGECKRRGVAHSWLLRDGIWLHISADGGLSFDAGGNRAERRARLRGATTLPFTSDDVRSSPNEILEQT